jgi:hypothetical protein
MALEPKEQSSIDRRFAKIEKRLEGLERWTWPTPQEQNEKDVVALATDFYLKSKVNTPPPPPKPKPVEDRPYPDWDYNQDKEMYMYRMQNDQFRFIAPEKVPDEIRNFFEPDRLVGLPNEEPPSPENTDTRSEL